MSLIYSHDEWKVKAFTNTEKPTTLAFFKAIKVMQSRPFTNKFLAYIYDSIKRKIIYFFGIYDSVKHLYKRFGKQAEYARSISSPISFVNSFQIIKQNGLLCSKKISIYNYVKGAITNITTGGYFKHGQLERESDDISEYFIKCRDFLTIDDRYMTFKFYKDAPLIKIKDDKVYIDNVLLQEQNKDIVSIALYQVLVVQQHISHLGIGHIIPTFAYTVFKNKQIEKHFKTNLVVETINRYGEDIRNVTDGFGKVALFTKGGENSMGIDDKEIEVIIDYLSDKQEMVYEDYIEKKNLVTELSQKVYKAYKKVIKLYIDNNEMLILSSSLNVSIEQGLNWLTNIMYSVTYHHNKSHYNLLYVQEYIKKNLVTVAPHILVNQVHFAMNEQLVGENAFLRQLKSELDKIKEGEGAFVCNPHAYVRFF